MRIQTMLLPCKGDEVDFVIIIDECMTCVTGPPESEELGLIKEHTGAHAVLAFDEIIEVV